MCKPKNDLSKRYSSLIENQNKFQKNFEKNIWFISKGDELFHFDFCLYSFIDFTREIDKWDEKKGNGVENWEPH